MGSSAVVCRRWIACLLALVVAFGTQLPAAQAADGATGTVTIVGTILSASTNQPMPGAQVYVVHLDTKQVFKSAPSEGNGKYQIQGLPFGYYDIAVLDTSGLFLANRVINAPAGEKLEISLALGAPQPEDTEWWSAEPDRRIPGLDRVPDGVARIVEGRPPKGVAAAKSTPAGATSGAATGSTVAKAGGRTKLAAWLVPLLGGTGIIALGILADDDDEDEDDEATPFAD
jgi:hypothetical protein